MKRGRWANDPERLHMYSRLGVIRAKTLVALGVSEHAVYRRCRPGGTWRRLLPGVILLNTAPPTWEQRLTAALLYAGSRALITGVQACLLHGLRRPQLPDDDRVHLLIPHGSKVQARGFTVIERTKRMPPAKTRHGFPVAPLVRAVIDATRRLRARPPVVKLIIEAIQKGRCTAQALSAELDVCQRRGTAIPRGVLVEAKNLKSIAEFMARRIANQMAVPPTHWNVTLWASDGFVGCPDAYWHDVCLVLEVDSVQHHFHADDYKRTVRRDARYEEVGLTVVKVLPEDLVHHPERVLAQLEAAYQRAKNRPRPSIIVGNDAA